MKRRARIVVAVLAFFVLIVGWRNWAKSAAAPRFVATAWDYAAEAVTGEDPITRCYLPEKSSDGSVIYGIIPARYCYAFDPPRKFAGIYIDEFEGQSFIPDAKPARRYFEPVENIWPEFEWRANRGPLAAPDDGKTRIWLVELIGRETSEAGRYGHMGGSRRLIVVDRVRSARLLSTIDGYAPDDVLVRR